jgi:DNA-binding CsgD family transcriptional regulator
LGYGGGIAEAAERLGLSIETARFYSKTLYAKLDVRGQAELTRRILTSVAVLS